MITITLVSDDWKREEGGLFKGAEGDHCKIKYVYLVTVDVSLCEIEHDVDLVDGDWLKLFLS